jgi:hypothetical protein
MTEHRQQERKETLSPKGNVINRVGFVSSYSSANTGESATGDSLIKPQLSVLRSFLIQRDQISACFLLKISRSMSLHLKL